MMGVNSFFQRKLWLVLCLICLYNKGLGQNPRVTHIVQKQPGLATWQMGQGLDMAWQAETRKIYLKQLIEGDFDMPDGLTEAQKGDVVLKNPIIIYTDEDILLAQAEIREAWHDWQSDSSKKGKEGQRVIISWEFVESPGFQSRKAESRL